MCLNPFQGLVGVSTNNVLEITDVGSMSQSLSGFGRCFYGAVWKLTGITLRSQSLSGFGRCFYHASAANMPEPDGRLNPFQGLVGAAL